MWEVVDPHVLRRLRLSPLPTLVVVVAEDLLFLCVDRDDGSPGGEGRANPLIDVLKLRVSVRVIVSFLRFPIPLKAVVQLPQQLRHLLMADRMMLRRQFGRQGARALAQVGLITGMRVANQEAMPAWRPDSPYNKPRGSR